MLHAPNYNFELYICMWSDVCAIYFSVWLAQGYRNQKAIEVDTQFWGIMDFMCIRHGFKCNKKYLISLLIAFRLVIYGDATTNISFQINCVLGEFFPFKNETSFLSKIRILLECLPKTLFTRGHNSPFKG